MLVVALDPDLVPTELGAPRWRRRHRCNYVWSSKQAVGALTCKDLPTTAFSVGYELWAIKGDKTVPVGTFLPRYDGTASLLVKFPDVRPGPVTNLWVTLEELSTGRNAPSSQVVLQPLPPQQADTLAVRPICDALLHP